MYFKGKKYFEKFYPILTNELPSWISCLLISISLTKHLFTATVTLYF